MKRYIKASISTYNKNYYKSQNGLVLFRCPRCTNFTVVDMEQDITAPYQVDYHDVCVCEDCGLELWSEPQLNGVIKFVPIPKEY